MENSLLIDGLCLPTTKGNEGRDMKEIWKPIPEYEEIYAASSLGRIRTKVGKTTSNARYSVRVWKTRILKPKAPVSSKRHDLRVTLWKDGKSKDYLVSRLVASAWHGTPSKGMTVNHKDGDYLNNHPENLEWVTLSDNIRHGFETGLFSSIQTSVILELKNGEQIYFSSMSEADRFLDRRVGYTSNKMRRGKTVLSSKAGQEYAVKKAKEVA